MYVCIRSMFFRRTLQERGKNYNFLFLKNSGYATDLRLVPRVFFQSVFFRANGKLYKQFPAWHKNCLIFLSRCLMVVPLHFPPFHPIILNDYLNKRSHFLKHDTIMMNDKINFCTAYCTIFFPLSLA